MTTIGIQQIDFAQQPADSSASSSAYTDRGHERVAALEHQFEPKERAQAQFRQQSSGKNVPLLLKPNGAPVFQNSELLNGSMNQTMKRGADQGQQTSADLERTVKAHNFVVGQPTQNHTNIAVLNVQKTSAAEDQLFPVRVLYVKPSMVKHTGRPRTAQNLDESQKRAIPKPKLAWQTGKNDDLEVSMGEVSGIFKEDRVPVKQPKVRKGLSADQIAKEKRIKAQREFSQEVRTQALVKAKELEQQKKLKEKTMKRTQEVVEEVDDSDLAKTVKKSVAPHSGNRFQGQFSSMTAELFKRAQEKLMQDKLEEKQKIEEQNVKREKEKQYLEEIKQRNIEILKQQRESGNSLPPGALKQREQKMKELKHRLEISQENQKRKELRQKRQSENRAMLGLDQVNQAKLDKLDQKREQQQAMREQERRMKERMAREQTRKAEEQRQAARQRLNRDLIDFTDPEAGVQKSTRGRSGPAPRQIEEEDDEAEEIMKQRRAAILAEQREKRRIKERIKAEQEAEEKLRREDEMRQLQETLMQQRMDIARKQQAAIERQERKERMRKREQQVSGQAQPAAKKGKKSKEATTDGPIELNRLKDWIDEQVKIDEQKMAKHVNKDVAGLASDKSPSPLKQGTMDSPTQAEDDSGMKDPVLTGYRLPGNHLLPLEQQRLVGTRENRYGVQGDNGFSDIAALQAEKEGINLLGKDENILDFVQPEGLEEEEQYDLQPVKQEKNQRRVIINRAQKEEEQSPAVKALPGVVNVKQEAAKELAEEKRRQTEAAIEIQKRYRGFKDRKKVKALRVRIRRDAEDDRNQFVKHYKMHDQYNLERYLKEKERLRKLNRTEKIEESISENLAQSSGLVDQVIGSFEQSKPMPLLQNLLGRAQQRASERDPNSLIALYAKNKAPAPVELVERERSRSGQKMEKRVQRQQKESKRLHMSGGTKRERGSSAKRKRGSYIDEEIEEDIPKSSNEKDDDQYSSDFQSEQISESLPSYLGSSKSKPKEGKSSSEIQESIQGSGTMGASGSRKDKDSKPKDTKIMASGTYDSIPEEVQSQSIVEEEIIDEVEDDVDEKEDEISEESFLKESKQGSAVRKAQSGTDEATTNGQQQQPTIPKKIERIREGIVNDFENDGAVPLAGSLKAQKMREMQEKLAKDQEQKYRMSRQIIDEFESKKTVGSEEHQRLIKGLAEEMQRYEAAVSGSIFIEQFQSIVQKSLAQRDMMMLGQRLAQMEAEKKHQQEIAEIRAEQLKMMSQLMLLQAGTGTAKTSEEQQELLRGIQKIVDKPVIIQRPADTQQTQQPPETPKKTDVKKVDKKKSDMEVIEESIMSYKSKQDIQKSAHQLQQSMKYTSMTQSQIKDSALNIGGQRRSGVSDSGGIADEIGSVQPDDDIEDSIIEESLNMDQSQSQQLSAARRYLGSEKAVQDTSKAVIDNKKKQPSGSVFENNSFQNYTNKKFKDLIFNDGSQMDVFLDQIENAINRKSEQQKKELKKQLDSNQISQKTFQQKQRDIERWVSAERKEIGEKRAKVQDTYGEIGQFLKKLEQDKNLIMDKLSNQSTPRNGLRRSNSNLSVTNSLKDVREQLREIQDGRIGGVQPETKYLNKKREYVRQLIQEKRDAIDRGVKEKMRDLESDMIDEAMQMALQLDVDAEVEKRMGLLRQKIDETKLEQSRKSMAIEESGKYSAIDQSRMSSTYTRIEKVSQKSGGKKNVKFHSPERRDPSSSYHSGSRRDSGSKRDSESKRDANKSMKSESIAEDFGDDIGESININESVQQSSASASKILRSQKQEADQSINKVSESNKISEQIPENVNEDEEDSINSRIQSDMDGSYTSDFASQSLARERSRSFKQGKDVEESEQYSAQFDEGSLSQSRKTGKGEKGIDQADEEYSMEKESQSRQSEEQPPKRDSIKSKKSQQQKKTLEKQRMPSLSDMTDREIFESTMSVDWQVTLQQKLASSYASELDEAPPAEEEIPSEPTEEHIESSIQEEESERTQEAGKGLEDLDSYPSASLSKSNEQEIQMRVDNITEELLNEILQDFTNDEKVRLEVEDNYSEEAFESKWPFSEAKKPVEEEKALSPVAAPPKQEEEVKKNDEQEKESEAQRQHDEAMKKYHEEQAALEAHHKKVVEYLDFMIQIVDKEVLMQALSKPIQHDPLRVLEKIQAFDGEDEVDQYSKQNISTFSQVFEPYLFDEIDRQWDELHQNKSDSASQNNDEKNIESDKGWTSKELRNVHHMAIFDAFNEALDLERPYKTKGLPNPWSKQTRLTKDALTTEQVDKIIARARQRVIEWDKTGAGTKFAPPPPPPPAQGDYDSPPHMQAPNESEEERTGAERRERLGLLLTKEVHQKETDWLDYEYEDTQVRFDLADMILEELADEVTQFLVENAESRGQFMDNYM